MLEWLIVATSHYRFQYNVGSLGGSRASRQRLAERATSSGNAWLIANVSSFDRYHHRCYE